MTRILIFLLWAVLIAGTVTLLMSFDSRISGEAFGVKFDSPSWLLIGVLAFCFFIAIYATHKIKDILAIPGKIRERDAKTKRERGVAALTRGLEAVAVGDAADASHHAKVAKKHLEDIALTRLLSAQAAQLSGDTQTARQDFAAMLDAPETEFLGLKGLYAQAAAAGDFDNARDYAERAFSLRSNARWAFQSVLELSLDRGAWGDAISAIEKGKRNNLIDTEKADRAAAAMHGAAAYEAFHAGDLQTAGSDAEASLKLASGFTPSAILAGQLHLEDDKKGKAASVLEKAFEKEAHPALIRLYDKVYQDAAPEKRASKLRHLADKNPGTREATLLRARASNLTEDFNEAMKELEPLITKGPDAYAYGLMATAMGGLHGEDVGRGWLERAATAPRDPRPGADGTFHITRAGWARLIQEYMDHERLAPPPLEDIGEAMSVEELRLLTAPPLEPSDASDDDADKPGTDDNSESEAAPDERLVHSGPDAIRDGDQASARGAEQDAGEETAPDADRTPGKDWPVTN